MIIGARGMLGRDLVEVLQSSLQVNQHPDREIWAWDLGDIDIQDESNTISKIENLRPEVVINVAAYTDVDGCEANEEKAFAINAEGMKHVARGAVRSGAKVVYISTDYVFDGRKRDPYTENDPPNPLNVYGRSKLKGEKYLQELVKDFLIIRTQWLFGRYGKNFVTSVLQQAMEKRVLSIVNDQIGSPTYTSDLARAISLLIQSNARGIFHVANSDFCSWYTFGHAILKLSGMTGVKIIPISSKELNRPAIRPSYSVLSTQKLKRETGMSLRSWSEALKEYLRLIR